jgi:acyl-CoA thioesterase
MSQEALKKILARSQTEPYAGLLGIELLAVEPGHALVSMRFSGEHQNMFGTMHGGALFSLMDAALQASSNSHGEVAVAQQVSTYYLSTPQMGARLVAESHERNRTRKTALYEIHAWQVGEDWSPGGTFGRKLATVQAICYRIGGPLPLDGQGNLTESA